MRRLVLAAAFALPGVALAQLYAYMDFKMVSSRQTPFPYYVDGRYPAPGGVGQQAMKTAVDNAWNTWNAVQCATPKVKSMGFTTGVVPNPADRYDAYNVTPVWATSASEQAYTDAITSQFVVAITIPVAYAGVLQTCDTYFNGVDYTWGVTGAAGSSDMDVETVMLHEAGHCLGLAHFGNAGDIMQVPISPGEVQHAFGPDDATALCQRYPSGGVGSPCLADGGCGGASTVRCVTETLGGGKSSTFCSQGCTVNTGSTCDFPLSCQTAPTFNPTYNGACLYPTTAVTQVGKACTAAADCGNSSSECFAPVTLPSGFPAWANGYCSQTCEPGQPPCPAGSQCFDLGNGTHHCLAGCRPGLADCRAEYTCAANSGDGGVNLPNGTCQPRCYTTADCPARTQCRTCDGLCVDIQNPSGQIGDVCTSDAVCGLGQVCLAYGHGLPVRQCMQQCGRGCGVCPTGSTCHALDTGDLFCLKDCSGPGTCPAQERCGTVGTGKACIPACRRDLDCPVGQSCNAGECVTPENLDDGGFCGALCNPPDAGHAVVVPVKDGGVGGGTGSGGCGCSASPLDFGWLGLSWALAVAARRRGQGTERRS